MSQKWRENQAWDREHLTGALTPVRWVLAFFSSVWTGISILVWVALYGILASVPVGMLAQIPTYLIYFATIVGSGLVAAAIPGALAWMLTKRASRGVRFAVMFPIVVGAFVAGIWAWSVWVWPHLRYDWAHHSGFMLFSDFAERYRSTTIRRLPGVEMTELQFYAWWPLTIPLGVFVVNMVVATVRRIDFNFKNIGVLTVHTGIVLIALGSLYYSRLKREGDTILFSQAAAHAHQGESIDSLGPPMGVFFDNTRVSLYVNQGQGWESRALEDVPRYNDYGLTVGAGELASRAAKWRPEDEEAPVDRSLSLRVPGPVFDDSRAMSGTTRRVDPAVRLRVVGYASYATEQPDWVRLTEPIEGEAKEPLRIMFLHGPENFGVGEPVSDRAVQSAVLRPTVPAERLWSIADGKMFVEFTKGPSGGMPEQRWVDLQERVAPGTLQALVIEVPREGGAPYRTVVAAHAENEYTLGETGFRVQVRQLSPRPTMPIITPGFRGAESSLAIVRITKPDGSQVDRYVYHRFPEINQDLSTTERNPQGMPRRTAADPAIRVALIDSEMVQVYIDEPGDDGKLRAIVRLPGGDVVVHDTLPNGRLALARELEVRVGTRWEDSRKITLPQVVPEIDRDKSRVGSHQDSMLAVEVTHAEHPKYKRVAWVPFNRYFFDDEPGSGGGQARERAVELPDGTPLWLSFGRRRWQLPGFMLQLADFKMISYDHRGSPRDYQATIKVTPLDDSDFEPYEHVAKLNAPLMAPFHWDESRMWVSNFFGRLASGLDPRQFKFSQAGWDRAGWERTQALVDQGQLERPRVGFTIMGVGNNPGIHIVALGAILMGLGIPWAFYVKPWLVQREKLRIRQQVAAGTYVKPGAAVVAVARIEEAGR